MTTKEIKKNTQIKTEPEAHDKSETKTKTTPDKIPNTLTIYIKTKIPGFYSFKYEPKMSVPKTNSSTVFFDPLIALNKYKTLHTPNYLPPDALYTQFFTTYNFDSLINRTIS